MADPGYVFGGNTGLSYADLKLLRELYGDRLKPPEIKSIGQGIFSVASDIADALKERRLLAIQREVQANEGKKSGTITMPSGDDNTNTARPVAVPLPAPTPESQTPTETAPVRRPGAFDPEYYDTTGTAALGSPEMQQRLVDNFQQATPLGYGSGAAALANPDAQRRLIQNFTGAQRMPIGQSTPGPGASLMPSRMSGRDAISAALVDKERSVPPMAYASEDGGSVGLNPTQPEVPPPATILPSTRVAGSSDLFAGRPADRIQMYDEPPNITNIRPAGRATVTVPSLLPSQEPIPGMDLPSRQKVGPAPDRPAIVMPNSNEIRAMQMMNDPNNSPALQNYAKNIHEVEQARRRVKQEQVNNDFIFERQQQAEDARLRAKQEYELPEKVLGQAKTRGEIESGRATLAQTKQTTALGTEHEGQRFALDPNTGKIVNVTPYIAPENVKTTEGENKELKYYLRAKTASQQLGDGSALAGFYDTVAGKARIPFTDISLASYIQSEPYQRQYSAARHWIENMLRDVSGAVLGESTRPDREGEIMRNFHDYFPQPGDSPAKIADKADRRRIAEESLYASLGKARPIADKELGRPDSRYPNAASGEGEIQISPSTGRRRQKINGNWVEIR